MKIARFEPWPYVDLLQRDLTHRTPEKTPSEWSPAVDITEESDQFLLRADLPGVAPTDIELSMDAGVLTVSGVRHPETLKENSDVRRTERSTGRFLRRFTLPETANTESITAKSSNGVLEISIPKQAEVQPRRINVEAA